MKKIINNYFLLVVFVLFLFKDTLYSFINTKEYKVDNCIYLKNLETNYNELLEFNNVGVSYSLDYINSYIIYKDVYNYLDQVTILKGKDYKLKKNYPIINNNTLVGYISKVNKSNSIVKLLTNKDSKISVKINEEIGILEYDNVLKITGISNYSNINKGDEIYTSGFGKLPENIYIGKVSDIMLDNKNIEKIIYIDYELDIRKINYVTVLKESKS